ncbi:SDR family NAD(P)-dependent oxidoreductase [Acidiplasma aeolicum]|uniref:Short-chain dehydrogenase n=1 Tax=Acidiplasma aeolicum TaxID=507754 RepID=A0A0Q0VLK9_9ARCH|nr:SDR family oxidoreductase [Acidiplasma aeolicum]KQB34336.1 hypothetical protein AOG54_05155 [Acidiplasma aeolicum]
MNIFIAGIGPGMGSAIAVNLKNQGHNIFLCSRGEHVIKLAEELKCNYARCDIKDYNSLEIAINRAYNVLGGLDAVINVSGNYFSQEPVESYDVKEFVDALENNAITFFNIIKASLNYLKESRGTAIGFSAAENVYLNSNPGYAAGKGAVYFMTKYLAHSLIQYGIRVNSIAPGFIDKENNPNSGMPGAIGRYPPDGVLDAINMLLHNNMITGEVIRVAGGHDIDVGSGL